MIVVVQNVVIVVVVAEGFPAAAEITDTAGTMATEVVAEEIFAVAARTGGDMGSIGRISRINK